MKKFLFLLSVLILSVSLVACNAQKTDKTPVLEEGVVYSYHSLTTPEDAKNDGVYAIAFDPDTDVAKTKDGYTMTVELYEYDLYNYDDIATLEVGSQIEMCQKIYTVETLETDEETGNVTINGGKAGGGFVLLAQAFEYRTDNEENNCPYLYSVGEITLPLSEDFKYTDNTKPNAEGKGTETDLSAFPASLEKGDLGYIPENTAIEVREGKIYQLVKYVLE